MISNLLVKIAILLVRAASFLEGGKTTVVVSSEKGSLLRESTYDYRMQRR